MMVFMIVVAVVGCIGFATQGRLTNWHAEKMPAFARFICAAIWLVAWLWFPIGVAAGAYKQVDGPSCRSNNLAGCFQRVQQ